MHPLRLLLLSTPVGPLGSGLGGGVELTVTNLAKTLGHRGHQIAIAVPAGSTLPADVFATLIQIEGDWQLTAQTQDRTDSVVTHSALANAWEYARKTQSQYDLLLNFAYDWLPFYLTPFFGTPVAHFVSMGSLNNAMDESIAAVASAAARSSVNLLGAYTKSQADTFTQIPADRWQIMGCGLELSQYVYCDRPGNALAWVGRISPEKGLEDAIAAANLAHTPLKIFGKLEDPAYWNRVRSLINKADVAVDYCGFLPTAELQAALGQASALLVTPRWIEAFGLVVIEALACGVPVIAYRCGGPAEIVCDGETGWLVEPGDVSGLASAIARIDQIDRQRCRQKAETLYSLASWGEGFERWFYQILSGMMSSE